MSLDDSKHNALASEFVHKVAGETKTYAEMMTVVESAILAAMMILSDRDGFSKNGAAEMIEVAINRAVKRFSAKAG